MFVVVGAVRGVLLVVQRPAMVPSWPGALRFALEIGKPWGDVYLCHLQRDHAVCEKVQVVHRLWTANKVSAVLEGAQSS